MAAVRIADATWEVTAYDVHLQSAAGAHAVVDFTQADGDGIDISGFERLWLVFRRVEDRFTVHGSGYPIHQQQTVAIRCDFNEFGDEVGVRALLLRLVKLWIQVKVSTV